MLQTALLVFLQVGLSPLQSGWPSPEDRRIAPSDLATVVHYLWAQGLSANGGAAAAAATTAPLKPVMAALSSR
jgi:hypothetical protein